MSYRVIDKCRICGNENLVSVISLGHQYLSGVFPSTKDHLDTLTSGPLELIKCHGRQGCGLLQLRQSYDFHEMYGDNYGYRSGLNRTMVAHLQDKVRRITSIVALNEGDCVVDIGSNDGTLLQAYSQTNIELVGIDPAGEKFRKYYPYYIQLISDFFSPNMLGNRKAKIVTSIAMFYDLEDPMQFMREVYDILADDGLWVLEQSYMPTMLENRSYDTICHEHLEYYGISQIEWMAERVGFRLVDVEINRINGGSFSVTLAKSSILYPSKINIGELIREELRLGLFTLDPYVAFARNVERSRQDLRDFVMTAEIGGKRICGLGASTKGNIILQYCDITSKRMPFIGDVNSDKFGCFTPGTQIPIISEKDMLAMKPDYLLVLPWHFRSFFEGNPNYDSAELVFPLPFLSIRH